MSAPVDVLSVMDAAEINAEKCGRLIDAVQAREARAAVAELIEVAKKARDRLLVSGFQADAFVAADLIDALARVGGGK